MARPAFETSNGWPDASRSISPRYVPKRASELHRARWRNATCAARTFSAVPLQAFKAGACKARPKEKLSSQGALSSRFIALRCSVARTSSCPPERKTTPATAAGTARNMHFRVASAACATPACCGQSVPASTMFGFSSIASRRTRCSKSDWKTLFRIVSVTSK